jgi:hypothetical protein
VLAELLRDLFRIAPEAARCIDATENYPRIYEVERLSRAEAARRVWRVAADLGIRLVRPIARDDGSPEES